MDKIVIKDLEVDAQIGVTDAERARPQRLLVTVEMELDLSLAGRTDATSATIGYDVVADLIRLKVSKKSRKLIEAVADEIADAILSRHMARQVTVEVKKFSVPRVQFVSVTDHPLAMKKSFLVWLGFGVLAAMSAGRADLVKLKDGTVWDGTILTEDDKQITVEVELAAGSITPEETTHKSNVVEIVRLTPEQKAERQMVREYEKAKKYQLDPSYSFPPATYDRVINDVLHKFLTQYSNSPYQQEITGLITDWETERDAVVAGQTKYRGKWMDAAEAAKLAEQDRDQRLLRLGQDFLSKGRYDEAIKHLHNLSQTGKDLQLITEARRLEAESYRLWLASLDRDQQRINDEIQSLGERVAKAQKAKERAQTSLSKTTKGKVRHMGADGFAFEATRAESEAKIAESQAEQLRKELASAQQFAADLRTRAGTAASAPAPTVSAAAQAVAASQTAEAKAAAQRAAAAEPTAMLDGVVQWVKDKWMFVAGGAVIGLWLIARLLTRS